ERATRILESLIKSQNHVGLMAEGVAPKDLSQFGNFPQAYSHVGLINCAFAIDRAIKKPKFLL
ncbi:MAG: glycoside hydrolase family 15 protein, partial [Bdellovibrionota bacterium]